MKVMEGSITPRPWIKKEKIMASVLKCNQYLVKFTFEIPVQVIAEKKLESEKIEAFYKARDIFFNKYTLTDSEMVIDPISKDEYERRKEVESKLHKYR